MTGKLSILGILEYVLEYVKIPTKLTRYNPDDSPYSMKEWLDIACNYIDRYIVNDEDMIIKVYESPMNWLITTRKGKSWGTIGFPIAHYYYWSANYSELS